jgi:hypothetical protein
MGVRGTSVVKSGSEEGVPLTPSLLAQNLRETATMDRHGSPITYPFYKNLLNLP